MNIIKSQNRIFGLDLMRSSAIVLVVVGHCRWIFPSNNGAGSQILAFSGYLGVELFFVLSGFLIGNILYKMHAENDFSLKSVMQFLKRRMFRTLPNYLLVLLVNLLIAAYIGYEVRDEWKYFLLLQNFAGPMPSFFPESWSVAVVGFAYLILPLSILSATATSSNTEKLYLKVVALLILISIAAKFGFHYLTPPATIERWNLAVRMVTVFRMDAIFIGALFSWIFQNYIGIWRRTKFLTVAGGLFMLGFFLFGIGKFQLTITAFPLFWNVFYLPITSLTIALFLPLASSWTNERTVISKPVTFISVISYSIYLLHYGVVLQLMQHFFRIGNSTGYYVHGFVIIYFIATITSSYLLYRYYEKPTTDLREQL